MFPWPIKGTFHILFIWLLFCWSRTVLGVIFFYLTMLYILLLYKICCFHWFFSRIQEAFPCITFKQLYVISSLSYAFSIEFSVFICSLTTYLHISRIIRGGPVLCGRINIGGRTDLHIIRQVIWRTKFMQKRYSNLTSHLVLQLFALNSDLIQLETIASASCPGLGVFNAWRAEDNLAKSYRQSPCIYRKQIRAMF